jgi:rRNA maturation endonuclease Nob1
MDVGDVNRAGQELLRKTAARSTTHRFARIWAMRCSACNHEFGSNSCDAHLRRCPECGNGAPGEPIDSL